jgi:hypothetical protein
MRAVSLAVAGALAAVLSAQVQAQPAPPPALPLPAPTVVAKPDPILAQPVADPATLPGGMDVSKPLQPVNILPAEPAPPPVAPPSPVPALTDDRNPTQGKVLGNWWDSDELLIWWPKATPLPPLVTGSPGPRPVLGRPTTSVLIGNGSIEPQAIAGYRLVHGWSLNPEDTVGFEGRFFFLGTRTLAQTVTDLGNDRFRAIGLPFVNARTGDESVLSVATPGFSSDLVRVSASTRVMGAEANLVGNLFAGTGVKLHAIAGYRYFQVNEGLRIEQSYLQYPSAGTGFHQVVGMIADQFDAHNEFHGGQLGLMADLHRDMFFVEMTGKAAFGTNFETVTIDGATHLITANYPVPLLQSYHGGVFAQPTNIGRVTRSVFAVVPEAMFKVGLKLGDRGRFYVGYNFLYLSDAVRPGDQIDRTINPTLIPLTGRQFAGLDQPRAVVQHSDFWVQGLLIGFETRF